MAGGIRAQVDVTTHMGAVIPEILSGAVRGQNLAGERLLALSVAEAPLDTADLIGSAQVVPAVVPGDDTLVVYDRPQAARLHEHPEYQFQNGRKGKYLEDPALHNKNELGQIIATEAGRG